MRFPEENEDLTGKVCICSTGRIAVVSGKGAIDVPAKPGSWVLRAIKVWQGIGFDGKGTWASSSPVVAYESVDEYRAILKDRFGGKLSFLG